jgi:flagellar biosynthesis protein FlhF
MHLKKYEVRSISEAMERIRRDLGPDAVILSSRRIGKGASSRIEIVAAMERDDVTAEEAAAENGFGAAGETGRPAEYGDRWSRVEARLDEMNDRILALASKLAFSGKQDERGIPPLYRELISRGLSRRAAGKLMKIIQDENLESKAGHDGDRTGDTLKRAIIRSVVSCSPGPADEKRICAFVGPAGEGKTTTLAKFAARILYRDKKSLGIITMDDFRIGAVEQLKIYGDIMNVPVISVPADGSLETAISSFAHLDRVLIDTPGKSRSDGDYVMKLRRSFMGSAPVRTNLVLSATTGEDAMTDAVRRFRPLEYERIVMTKIDDAGDYGCVYNVIDLAGRPVTDIATGQQVPRDIRSVDPQRIARLVVDREIPRH